MADGNATESVEQIDKVTLRVMFDKKENKVLYAEAGKDFVDALLSFLTLPLGTIVRLVSKESNIEAVKFGSISSLYQCVSELDVQYLSNETCKEVLLHPINTKRAYCQNMKLNIDDTPVRYFFCKDCKNPLSSCRNTSTSRKQRCSCGNLFDEVYVSPYNLASVGNGFFKKTATFIVQDDLCVMPNDLGTILCLLRKHGINNITEDIQKKSLLISKQEVIDLLKLSLLSKTPLTYFISKKEKIVGSSNLTFQIAIRLGEGLTSHGSDYMVVKVMRRKSTKKILFAIAEEDFADFLFSFLTFPLGGVLQKLSGFSSLTCLDNLYRSMSELSPECVRPHELQNILNPKSSISLHYSKGPLKIMVTDDLVVIPLSSIDGISYLEGMKIPLNDMEEMVINIGKDEGLSILKASLTSTSALTNGLSKYIDNLLNNPKRPSVENEA